MSADSNPVPCFLLKFSTESYLPAPLPGQIEAAADNKPHKAGQGIPVPETLAPHMKRISQEGCQAYSGDHPVNDRYQEVQLRVPGTVLRGWGIPVPSATVLRPGFWT